MIARKQAQAQRPQALQAAPLLAPSNRAIERDGVLAEPGQLWGRWLRRRLWLLLGVGTGRLRRQGLCQQLQYHRIHWPGLKRPCTSSAGIGLKHPLMNFLQGLPC